MGSGVGINNNGESVPNKLFDHRVEPGGSEQEHRSEQILLLVCRSTARTATAAAWNLERIKKIAR